MRVRASLSILLAAAAVACTEPRASAPATPLVPWGSTTGRVGDDHGARIAYLPGGASELHASLDLEGGKKLLVGAHGERWLVDDNAKEARAAGELAPEELVAVARRDRGGFVFVGAQGALLEAPEPLAPFSRSILPPEAAKKADARGSTVTVVTARGALLVSTDGGDTWSRAPLGGGRVVDAALLDAMHGYALELPEKLFETKDGGRTFVESTAPTIGAVELSRGVGDELREVGLFRARELGAAPVRRTTNPPVDGLALGVDLAPAPSAEEIRSHRAVLMRGETWALVFGARKGEHARLRRAKLGERFPEEAETIADDGCRALFVWPGRDAPLVTCTTTGDHEGLKLFRRKPEGGFEVAATIAAEVHPGDLRVALGDGGALLAGVCRKQDGHHCDGASLVRLTKIDGATEDDLAPVSAPALLGAPRAVAFGARGGAYLIGHREKSDELALFVSRDGGRSFSPRDLRLPGGDAKRHGPLESTITGVTLSIDAEGLVSVGLEGTEGASFATFDEDGRPLGASRIGSTNAQVGIFGNRALFVENDRTWESADGGATTIEAGSVAALACPARSGGCAHPVVCDAGGCLIDSDVARIGWGPTTSVPRPHDLAAEGRVPPPRALPPLVCRLDKGKWTTLPKGAREPQASDADRGKVPWAIPAQDARGAVSMVHGLANGTIETVSLLGPVSAPATVAQRVSSQHEGGAALRFTWRRSANDDGRWGDRATLEVGWENLFDGRRGHATLSDLGNVEPTDVRLDAPGGLAGASVALLSVTQGGIFVRMHEGGPMAFVDLKGSVVDRRPVAPFPPLARASDFSVSSESVRVGGASIPLGFLADGSVARFAGGQWDAFAIEQGQPDGGDHIDFGYLGTEPQLVFRQVKRGAPRTLVFPFRADGPVLGPPTRGPDLFAAIAKPRTCTADDRAKTTRVLAPGVPGTHRAILVEAADGSLVAPLVSEGAVLYGTADAPCIAAVEAVSVPDENGVVSSERSLVFPGDLEHGWLFRVGLSETQDVEARPMKCHVDANAELPPNLATLIGD